MEEFLTALPQLSIGVVAVLAFAISIYWFIRHLEGCNVANAKERAEFLAVAERERAAFNEEREKHLAQIEEHHTAMRDFEKEVRTSVMVQLAENSRLFTRLADYLRDTTRELSH